MIGAPEDKEPIGFAMKREDLERACGLADKISHALVGYSVMDFAVAVGLVFSAGTDNDDAFKAEDDKLGAFITVIDAVSHDAHKYVEIQKEPFVEQEPTS